MKKLLLGAGLAALAWTSSLQAQGSNSLAADAAAFGARDSVKEAVLSPDGTSVLYLTPGPGSGTIAVLGNLATGKFTQVANSDGAPSNLRWCNFVSTSRAVCRFSGNVESPTYQLLGFARLIAIDLNGGDSKLLGQSDSPYDAWIRQYDGTVIDWLGASDNRVLMSREYVPEEGKIGTRFVRTKHGVGVDRLDTKTLRTDVVEPPRDGASGYMSDGRGVVRLMFMPEISAGGMLSGRARYLYRTPQSRDWKELVGYQEDEFEPLAIDADSNRLYALKKKDGRYALYGITLDAGLNQTPIAENPRVDIDGVVRLGEGRRVIGYTFSEEKRKTVYFDPEFKALSASLSKALPNLPLVNFDDASRDGRKLMLHAGSDSDPGRYYLFDRDKKTLEPAMLDRPELEGRTLASVKPVTITAGDGTQIPAYLTLPPGRGAKGLPAVVLPHGGPSARDEWGFDWLAQFLAARGYAVLQPNYRGSAGYGEAWLNENGFRNWRTSIGDITTSAKWLASQGIADPNKLAIVGWSYGGYAALQSAATEPSLYKAVVAIAPVTDLAQLKLDASKFTNARWVERQIGAGPHVAEGSPTRHAAAITAPVLLVHGDLDTNVWISHSRKMEAELKSAGKQSELLIFKGLDHQLDDNGARTQMLTKIGALLERTIGK